MSTTQLKIAGAVCLLISATSFFVAWERYQDNAQKVAAANQLMQSSPLGGLMQEMTGGSELKAAMPAATKYGIGVGTFAAISGVVLLVMPGASPSRKDRIAKKSVARPKKASTTQPSELASFLAVVSKSDPTVT